MDATTCLSPNISIKNAFQNKPMRYLMSIQLFRTHLIITLMQFESRNGFRFVSKKLRGYLVCGNRNAMVLPPAVVAATGGRRRAAGRIHGISLCGSRGRAAAGGSRAKPRIGRAMPRAHARSRTGP